VDVEAGEVQGRFEDAACFGVIVSGLPADR
jgi:hypothetical protein